MYFLGYDYDLVVIGGGSGGLACSKEGNSMFY
jgi:pyruvate/2-oxoglutarate dehydrogenase complex dihydrolipoamide dehydrogenase (E3) component